MTLLVNFNVTLRNSDEATLATKNFPGGTNTRFYTFSKTVKNVRFVRVHLLGKGPLSLAEVQVIGNRRNDGNDTNDRNEMCTNNKDVPFLDTCCPGWGTVIDECEDGYMGNGTHCQGTRRTMYDLLPEFDLQQ